MSARDRNKSWIYGSAQEIAKSKRGLVRGMVTVGEVVKGLGFSSATVRKYFDALIVEGHMDIVVDSPSVKIYRVKDLS